MSENAFKRGIEDVYDDYADMLFRISYSILLSKEDAEDAVHDVFAKFLAAPPDFLEKEHEKAWFIKLAVNRCRDILRKNKVRSYVPLDEIAEIPAEDKGSSEVFEAVLRLPEKFKTVILLHYFEGFGVSETAKLAGISDSAAKMRLLRGRELLKNELGRDDFDE